MKTWIAWGVCRSLFLESIILLPSVLTCSTVWAELPQDVRAPQAKGGNGASEANSRSGQRAKAEQLLQRALESELAGESARRDALLNDALQVAPDFAAAHWHSGHVRQNQQWVSIADAQQQAAAAPHRAEYEQLREQYAGTLDGELNLQPGPAQCECRSSLSWTNLSHFLYSKISIRNINQ
jgi:hypothetical protein